ncbi:MAG: hypothetical protein NT120_00180 [Candidatus Aenigmarchaeota archaeon]|nr:hypothetical protein [Candidatus Aenigmarchaeota archaeon]
MEMHRNRRKNYAIESPKVSEFIHYVLKLSYDKVNNNYPLLILDDAIAMFNEIKTRRNYKKHTGKKLAHKYKL